MPTIGFRQNSYDLAPNETVLECLLRHGHAISNSCRAGACQACLLKTTSGTAPAHSSQILQSTFVAQGYFLSCICRPEIDLTVEEPGQALRVATSIHSVTPLSQDVALVRIHCPNGFQYEAGQYVTLIREDGVARSYSIASLPGADHPLELHVRRIPGGTMSNWLHDQARPGQPISMQGPVGTCFYTEGKPEQPILLAGTGTGLAPLYGILQDALRLGHTGPIWLFHGALLPEGLYLQKELRELADAHSNFHYTAVVVRPDEGRANGPLEIGPLPEVILRHHPKLSGWRGFICGDPDIVGNLKMKFFLAGMSNRDVFADAFLPTPRG